MSYCKQTASVTITGHQPALGLTDFPTSCVFCLRVRFLSGSQCVVWSLSNV